jgi:DNA-binding response OmpR family regulator
MTVPDRLPGYRILVVEDETLLAVTIEEILQDLGCEVVGPIGRLDAALRSATHDRLDVAVLDISIRGGLVFPVAKQLLARGTPSCSQAAMANGHCPPTSPIGRG